MENFKPSETSELPSSGDGSKFMESLKGETGAGKSFMESLVNDVRLPPSGLNRAENLSPKEFPPPTGEDKERMDAALKIFWDENWDKLSLEEKKQAIKDLAGFIADETENKNPPKIIFRDDLDGCTGGWYDEETNTIVINEKMIDDPCTAVEITAHEMWHAHQYQCVMDPTSEEGRKYKKDFDNYIKPEYDYEGYQNQMIEVEARDFAQVYVDELTIMEWGVICRKF
jgi:hypothetical protein